MQVSEGVAAGARGDLQCRLAPPHSPQNKKYLKYSKKYLHFSKYCAIISMFKTLTRGARVGF
jgi:hypothetical protein